MKYFSKKFLILSLVIIFIVFSIYFIQNTTKKPITNEKYSSEVINLNDAPTRIKEKSKKYELSKELVDPNGYLNTDKITIKENVGKKIILVDFWTYSCINCQRTLPYLNTWHDKYKDKGLLIIGVHTPEFEFEKDYNNVKKAVEKYKIKYPVVQDNEYKTWKAYNNHYWPRKYLIDIDGFIVYDHIGEGAYEETEKKIQELLEERNYILKIKGFIDKNTTKPNITDVDFQKIGTPEIYFGHGFSRNQIGNIEGWQPNEIVNYKIPENLENNKFYLEGDWLNNIDNMELKSNNGKIKLMYYAKNVNIVAGSMQKIQATIYLDGIEYKKIDISEFDLYNLISFNDYGQHTLEIKLNSPGLMAYTFTFG